MSAQVPHNLWDIITNEMTRLLKKCDDKNVPYLWDCLGVLFKGLSGNKVSAEEVKVMHTGIHHHSQDGQEFLNSIDELQHRNTPIDANKLSDFLDTFIQFWVENMSQNIIPQLKSSMFHLLSFQQSNENENDESSKKLFQRTFHVQCKAIQKYNIFPCQSTSMQAKSFLDVENENNPDVLVQVTGTVDNFRGVFKENRFAKKTTQGCNIWY